MCGESTISPFSPVIGVSLYAIIAVALSGNTGLRWQKWGVYQRTMQKGSFQYSVEDYVFQNMLRDLDRRVLKADVSNKTLEASLWGAVAQGFRLDEEMQIQAVMKAYYSAMNRKNFDEIRMLWIPDESAEIVLPGYERVVSIASTLLTFDCCETLNRATVCPHSFLRRETHRSSARAGRDRKDVQANDEGIALCGLADNQRCFR
jgi:hypothetical protein